MLIVVAFQMLLVLLSVTANSTLERQRINAIDARATEERTLSSQHVCNDENIYILIHVHSMRLEYEE